MNPNLRLWENKTVIEIVAGKGGVGKSTIAALIGRALARSGSKVLMMDADVSGPSLPYLLPVEESRYRTENGLVVPHPVVGEDNLYLFSIGHMLAPGEHVSWQGVHIPPFIHIMGSHLADDDIEIVVIDMPPGTNDVAQGVALLCPHVKSVVVTTAGEVALGDVQRLLESLTAQQKANTLGVIENMAWPEAAPEISLWGNSQDVQILANSFHMPLLGRLPLFSIASKDEQVAMVSEIVLPVKTSLLQKKSYLDIDPIVIDSAAHSLMAEHDQRRSANRMGLTWQIDNLAHRLEFAVQTLGGNPADARYFDAYRRNLRLLWAHMGNSLNGEVDENAWWYPVYQEMHEQEEEKKRQQALGPNSSGW